MARTLGRRSYEAATDTETGTETDTETETETETEKTPLMLVRSYAAMRDIQSVQWKLFH